MGYRNSTSKSEVKQKYDDKSVLDENFGYPSGLLKSIFKLSAWISFIVIVMLYGFAPYTVQRHFTAQSELVSMSESVKFFEVQLQQNRVKRISFYPSEEQFSKNLALPVVAHVKTHGAQQVIPLGNASTDLYMGHIEINYINERWVVSGSQAFNEVVKDSSDRHSELKLELKEAIAQVIVQIERGQLMLL